MSDLDNTNSSEAPVHEVLVVEIVKESLEKFQDEMNAVLAEHGFKIEFAAQILPLSLPQ